MSAPVIGAEHLAALRQVSKDLHVKIGLTVTQQERRAKAANLLSEVADHLAAQGTQP